MVGNAATWQEQLLTSDPAAGSQAARVRRETVAWQWSLAPGSVLHDTSTWHIHHPTRNFWFSRWCYRGKCGSYGGTVGMTCWTNYEAGKFRCWNTGKTSRSSLLKPHYVCDWPQRNTGNTENQCKVVFLHVYLFLLHDTVTQKAAATCAKKDSSSSTKIWTR